MNLLSGAVGNFCVIAKWANRETVKRRRGQLEKQLKCYYAKFPSNDKLLSIQGIGKLQIAPDCNRDCLLPIVLETCFLPTFFNW